MVTGSTPVSPGLRWENTSLPSILFPLSDIKTTVETLDPLMSHLNHTAATETTFPPLEWNDTDRDYSRNLCIHELFEIQAQRRGESVAAVFEAQQLTYQELNRRSNQLAHYLRKREVGPEVLVGGVARGLLEALVREHPNSHSR